MKKYYLVTYNTEYLSTTVLSEGTDKEQLQAVFINTVKGDLVDVIGLSREKADVLVIKTLASYDDVDPCLSIGCDSDGPCSATIRYGCDYETYINIVERDIPSYHIESLCYDTNLHVEPNLYVEPYTESYDDVHYTDRSHALVAAQMLALSEAQDLNEGNRETVGGPDACWFSTDENGDEDESDGYDYMVSCWDGEDCHPVTKYKVVEDK